MTNLLEQLDQNQISNYESNDKVIAYLKAVKNQDITRFNVGDILIRQVKSYRGHNSDETTWVDEKTSDVTSATRKYIYAYENEFGIGFIKPLTANGKGLGNSLVCMTEIDHERERFMVCPDYQDHVLFGEGDYDYNASQKAARRRKAQIDKKNKELLVQNIDTRAKVNDFLDTLVPGTKIWIGSGIKDATENEYEVMRVTKRQINPNQRYESQGCDGTTTTIATLEAKYGTRGNTRSFTTKDLSGWYKYIYVTQPFKYDENQ